MNKRSRYRAWHTTLNTPIDFNKNTQRCVLGGCLQTMPEEGISNAEANFFRYWPMQRCCWCPCPKENYLKVENLFFKMQCGLSR